MKITSLHGFQAAAIAIDQMLDGADKERPEKATVKMRESKSYKEGYYDGLLIAHCMMACGRFPHFNEQFIRGKLAEKKD